jgi:hypothetical protein
MGFDLSDQALSQSSVQLALHAPLLGRSDMSQCLKPLDISLHTTQADHEDLGNLAFRLALLAAFDDPFPQVKRVSLHSGSFA